MMIFHQVIMRINSRAKTVFFCGTHGAIKKSVLEEVGSWNAKSITEDADLSIKMLLSGYKTLYLPDVRARGEVPWTLDSFLKQQTRWTYGQARAVIENARTIASSRTLVFSQKFMLLFSLFMYLLIPFVIVTALTGQLGWIINPPKAVELADMVNFSMIFFVTFGYGAMGAAALSKERVLRRSWKTIVLIIPLGLVLAVSNLFAFSKAALNKPMDWIKTPKFGSRGVLDVFRWLFE
jgi:cellulose synthase/poly-beta-1,6-N-acetylglucosamine synthase-like glycosyltransferase